MKLSQRLQAIADLVEPDTRVADIGTDHGYLSAYLVENNIAKNVIATDINEKPLKKAQDHVAENNLADKIQTRLGSGLEPIAKGEVDIAVIAGMGGYLIADILEDSRDIAKTINTFILQPMSGEEELRKYLYENDYTIVAEKLAREGKRFYFIIKAVHGKDTLEDDIYLEIGKKLIEDKDELAGELIKIKIEKIKTIMDNLVMKETENSKKTYKDFKNKCTKLKGLLKEYES